MGGAYVNALGHIFGRMRGQIVEFDTGPMLVTGSLPMVIHFEGHPHSREIIGFGVKCVEYGRLAAAVGAEEDHQLGGFGDVFDYQMGEALEVFQLDGFDFHCGPLLSGDHRAAFLGASSPRLNFLSQRPRGAGRRRWGWEGVRW